MANALSVVASTGVDACPRTLQNVTPSTQPQRARRIVAIGGGTGLPAVLEGLCTSELHGATAMGPVSVTAVVTVTDEGGSSGRLRQELGVRPPGDVRNCLAAIAETDSLVRQLLQHRFTRPSGLEGHPVGNLLLTALTEITGDFAKAIEQLSAIIGIRGRVLPSTNQDVRLRAEMATGDVVVGETEIVRRGVPIRRLSLQPSPRPLPEVLQALVNADAVVVGPGSLYTSVLPNLLVEGIASTISGLNATKIYVANLMTEPGETDGYDLDDHLRVIRQHTGFDLFDYIVVNRTPLDASVAARYAEGGSRPVLTRSPLRWTGAATIVECDLGPEGAGNKIRHNPVSLARAIRTLVEGADKLA